MNGAKIGFIGCGIMGEALIRAICKQLPSSQVIIFDIDATKKNKLAKELGCITAEGSFELSQQVTHIFLAVKPTYITSVLKEIRPLFNTKDNTAHTALPVIISIAAGVTLSTLSSIFTNPVKSNPMKTTDITLPHFIRLMPNLPAIVGESMIGLCATENTELREIETIKMILSKAGIVDQVTENLMNGVTAISGSGPAYGFLFIEALADAAVLFGIPRNQAYTYAAQTLKGAAQTVLATGRHPAELKDAVCSPAGTTIEAVKVLEDEGFRSAIIKASQVAFIKSIELGKK